MLPSRLDISATQETMVELSPKALDKIPRLYSPTLFPDPQHIVSEMAASQQAEWLWSSDLMAGNIHT